ncbi:response regulator [Cohnella terricola]|uniref:Response regulator n=1 Tax=Cohnella terricola TaxID=1289167 RepID=A0A559JBR5_9BACL|nr:response regulator [Cohnella terricola]TVX97322.1 response regulator [Cohnella terricola]
MYKIILIDDEDEVREGIKYKTPWKEYGFELIGDFENGRDAWEAMETLKPDAVITDICMPFMDGLELTQLIYESFRDVKVVIVTGFEDFDYAQRAIKLKVNDYLLKPLNLQEFTDFLSGMKRELDEEHSRKNDLSSLKSQLHQSFPLLKERFLERLVAGTMPQEELESGLDTFRIRLDGSSVAAFVGDLDEPKAGSPKLSDSDLELHRFGAYNIMQEIVETEHGGVVFRTRDHKVAAFISASPERLALHAEKLAGDVRRSVEKYLNRTMTIGVGRPGASLEGSPVSFREALSALDYRFMLGTNRTISIRDVEFGSGGSRPLNNDWEKKMIAAMRTGSGDNVTNALQAGFDELRSSGKPADKIFGIIHKLVAALMNWIAETGLRPEDSFEDDVFAQIGAMKTLDAIQSWLNGQCLRILADMSAKRSNVASLQMMEAERFITGHYMNEELTLNDICSHLYISTSYFSTLFKQHTGMTFVEYLTRTRIEQAKQLLAITTHKTYEIAQQVGYGDPHYFSVIFKRHTGLTPKEYRSMQKGIS